MNARTFIPFGDHKTEKFKLKKVERSRVTIDHEMGFITKDTERERERVLTNYLQFSLVNFDLNETFHIKLTRNIRKMAKCHVRCQGKKRVYLVSLPESAH